MAAKKKTPAPSGLIEITTSTEPVATEPLFSIDGVVYSMPVEVPGNVALGYLEQMRQGGEAVAIAWALEQVLGEKAYQALVNCKSLQPHQLSAIMTIVTERIMGALEAVRGE